MGALNIAMTIILVLFIFGVIFHLLKAPTIDDDEAKNLVNNKDNNKKKEIK